MTSNVFVKIKGMQFQEEQQAEDMEFITTGTYSFKNGKHFLLYDELLDENSDTPTHNTLKMNAECVEITKKGLVNAHILFQEKEKSISYYTTPFGTLTMGFDTKKLSIQELDDKLLITIDYTLEINQESVADSTISIEVVSKEHTKFRI